MLHIINVSVSGERILSCHHKTIKTKQNKTVPLLLLLLLLHCCSCNRFVVSYNVAVLDHLHCLLITGMESDGFLYGVVMFRA